MPKPASASSARRAERRTAGHAPLPRRRTGRRRLDTAGKRLGIPVAPPDGAALLDERTYGEACLRILRAPG